MKKKYDLIIVTGSPFPNGGVMVNRIMSYAIELVKRRKSVLVVSKHRTIFYGQGKQVAQNGEYFGVDYDYLMPVWREKKVGFIQRSIIDRIIRIIRFYYFFLFKYRCHSFQYYSRETCDALRLYLIACITHSRLYREISEAPLYIKNRVRRFFDTQYCRLYDGMVVMTEGIRQYYNFIPDKRIFILPMSVDLKRFDIRDEKQRKYFFYCSGGNLERDGLIDSINGFLLFYENHRDYVFLIATSLNLENKYDQIVKQLIDNNDCIKYIGLQPIEKIPIMMVRSMGLLVTPHQDYQTKGFPTKLGEYLASGRPVVCTSIETLKNNIPEDCVYMVNPNSPRQIAESLHRIVSCMDESHKKGEKGKKFVEARYTVNAYATELCKFLKLN